MSGVLVKFLADCNKIPEERKITVLGSDYIAGVNVLFSTKCAILHRYQCVILHLVFDLTSDG